MQLKHYKVKTNTKASFCLKQIAFSQAWLKFEEFFQDCLGLVQPCSSFSQRMSSGSQPSSSNQTPIANRGPLMILDRDGDDDDLPNVRLRLPTWWYRVPIFDFPGRLPSVEDLTDVWAMPVMLC